MLPGDSVYVCFDIEGIMRAARTNADQGQLQQGGSTITEQLIKQTINRGKKRTPKLKIQEAVTALNRFERALERYLDPTPS